MVIISRLPGIGLYVHMLSKVMSTVLNFFTTYFWSFAGYAIAFHILLPHVDVFSSFPDAFIKVGAISLPIGAPSGRAHTCGAKLLRSWVRIP